MIFRKCGIKDRCIELQDLEETCVCCLHYDIMYEIMDIVIAGLIQYSLVH